MAGGVFFHGRNIGPVTCVAVKDLRPSLLEWLLGLAKLELAMINFCLPFSKNSAAFSFVFSCPVDFFSDFGVFFLRLDESFHSVFLEFI